MTRPSIVRADTIDLQDHSAPSAKDHGRPPIQSAGAGINIAPHQAETLREVAHEAAEEQSRSPRLSWASGNGDPFTSHHTADDDNLAAGLTGSFKMAQQKQTQQDQEREHQEDALAIAQNGGVSSSDEGDMDDSEDMDDDMMDRISSSPSIEDEDIDFEFVYALHTFVATVEGQANATKGDTMVLLDDSNSYWWLVRVVKDSSIGYLPAEHIETPTERLARLNKHRNVDLSAAMLGDQASKQKSTFKSIRKRKKTVTFTDPTYVDYSDINYSSDEDELEEMLNSSSVVQQQQQQQKDQQEQDSDKKTQQAATDGDEITEEAAKVEPLKTRSQKDAPAAEVAKDTNMEIEEARDSEEILDGRNETVNKSKYGTVRNTDSFYRDETVETKKITLTPKMLLDDDEARQSTDSVARDAKIRASLEKELLSDKEKKKSKDKDKKEKDKKPSAIRSFFSRKDKRRTSEDDDESFGKRSMDAVSEPRDSEDPAAVEQSPDKSQPTRSPSKLQKQQPRLEPSLARKTNQPQTNTAEIVSYLNESRTNDVSNVPPASMRIVDPETKETQEIPSNQLQQQQQPAEDKTSLGKSPVPRTGSNGANAKPQKAMKAKTRMELDESDSSEVEEALLEQPPQFDAPSRPPPSRPVPDPLTVNADRAQEKALRPQLPGAFPDSFQTVTSVSSDHTVTANQNLHPNRDRLSESPVEVSPLSPIDPSKPPELLPDIAPDSPSPEYSSSPDFSQVEEAPREQQPLQPSWDDTKLRAFFDQSDYVRDLLTVVYGTSDHHHASINEAPVVSGVFREQNARLAEMTTKLDNMLGDWLARKQRLRGTL